MTDLLEYSFFQNAIVACVLAGLVCGLAGTYIVSRRMGFLAGGMAHTCLGGVGICALAGWPVLLGCCTLFVAYGLGSVALGQQARSA